MNRNKKLVLLPHCYLNQNCVVKNEARDQGQFLRALDTNTSYIQMECPEYNVYGLKRSGVGKNIIEKDGAYIEWCNNYCLKLIDILKDYMQNDCIIEAVVGIKGSPSCGVTKTCMFDNEFYEANGMGLFNEILMKQLNEAKIKVSFIELEEL